MLGRWIRQLDCRARYPRKSGKPMGNSTAINLGKGHADTVPSMKSTKIIKGTVHIMTNLGWQNTSGSVGSLY